ncbi:MAG: Glutamate-tRNA ligase GltX [Candidatus Magasanikbacteria bacterium GW2011_GWA2_37_8]|uniref:Glutamate--tRNA ligase n=1 Tax=Candidatus Magasanikbacteria bacterium GW2011_GWA2_37_8 TaxID=1619036 RepID=A0A0G0HRF5_9BACT|nr:MAG: Glutamate-tRNA ligase GltX [Candidatus Magasanikbacteria bacterium GW2011_GWA2_37_8]
MIRTRFAPSPTGFMHVGNLKMAITDYLISKQSGGQFLLRVEDTDRTRMVEGAVENLLHTLNWVGIIPDEGVKLGQDGKVVQVGDKGPYIQSERLEIYHKYVDELLGKGHAYYCFCSKERLEEVRKKQEENKQATGYDGHCRDIILADAKKRIEAGEGAVVRMRTPKEGVTKFNDLIRGEVVFENKLVDDQVILKSDGFPTYHLAVVVDDHLMEITHVIRGDEWMSSTPKHLVLYEMFGWQPPLFAHLPLLLNPDKSKLSKRQGDVAVEDYIKKGYLPEAIINFIAFLGWNPGDERELFSLEELIKEFSLEKVTKSGAVFNLEKLDWYNKEYLKRMDNEELAGICRSLMMEKYGITNYELGIMGKILALEKERATTLIELVENVKFVFELPNYDSSILIWKKSNLEEAKNILQGLINSLDTFSVQDWDKTTLEQKVGEWIKEKGFGNGNVLSPLRVALSGQQNSPGPFEIAEVLGKEETINRLQTAIKKIT